MGAGGGATATAGSTGRRSAGAGLGGAPAPQARRPLDCCIRERLTARSASQPWPCVSD